LNLNCDFAFLERKKYIVTFCKILCVFYNCIKFDVLLGFRSKLNCVGFLFTNSKGLSLYSTYKKIQYFALFRLYQNISFSYKIYSFSKTRFFLIIQIFQVYWNYVKKNTKGFSMTAFMFDFAGGVFCITQELLDYFNGSIIFCDY